MRALLATACEPFKNTHFLTPNQVVAKYPQDWGSAAVTRRGVQPRQPAAEPYKGALRQGPAYPRPAWSQPQALPGPWGRPGGWCYQPGESARVFARQTSRFQAYLRPGAVSEVRAPHRARPGSLALGSWKWTQRASGLGEGGAGASGLGEWRGRLRKSENAPAGRRSRPGLCGYSQTRRKPKPGAGGYGAPTSGALA